jgi:leucyl aminopeptidase
VRIELSDTSATDVQADLLCLGLFSGEELPAPFAEAPGAEDAEGKFKSLTVLRPQSGTETKRVLVVGLGDRDDFTTERARVAGALGVRQAARVRAGSVAWACPTEGSTAAGLTAGSILASYSFDRYRSRGEDDPEPSQVETLTLLGAGDAGEIVETSRVAAEAANRARDLQNLPANVADPAYLADRAAEIVAGHENLEFEILGPERLETEGMGGILAVSAGSEKDPALIVLRYNGGGSGPTLGLVGKGVTFDSGGISIKPSAGMELMKKDMSGGAAVLEATAAIAELALPINVISVIPAVENMPSGSAMRPGDIITQLNGKTVEINNTDAEGRLILADALTWCERQGAERIVDLATLTGAVVVALGSTYAGLMSNDDDWAGEVEAAGEVVGELAWRLPLHPEYKDLTRGTVADLVNSAAKRKAGTIYAASFLEEFVGNATWAHLDIAGTSWDVGREYVGNGATGFGVRLLVELARRISAE